jgi:hypothetical protein
MLKKEGRKHVGKMKQYFICFGSIVSYGASA